jgi:hypothetical protein
MLFEGDFAHRVAPGVRSTLRQLLYRIPAILYQSGGSGSKNTHPAGIAAGTE